MVNHSHSLYAKTDSSGTSRACLFPAARKCSVKDGCKKLKKKVADNCLDRNDSNKLLGTSFVIVSKSGTDFANKVS